MFNNMWDVKEPKHYSKRVGREVPGVVAVLCVVNTGPMLIAVTTITEMVILYKYVEIIIIIIIFLSFLSDSYDSLSVVCIHVPSHDLLIFVMSCFRKRVPGGEV